MSRRLLLWLQGKWNRLSPDGKAATTIALLTLVVTIAFGLRSVQSGDSKEGEVTDPIERIGLDQPDPPANQVAVKEAETATGTETSTIPTEANMVATATVRQCPSEIFAGAQGDWTAELVCDGQRHSAHLSLQFVSAKEVDATLVFDRSSADSGDSGEPMTSELHGEFEADNSSVYLTNRRGPLRVGYPLVELQFLAGGLGTDRLRAQLVDVESRRATCGTLTAERRKPSFGGRSYPKIVFNRRRPTKPTFDPNAC